MKGEVVDISCSVDSRVVIFVYNFMSCGGVSCSVGS